MKELKELTRAMQTALQAHGILLPDEKQDGSVTYYAIKMNGIEVDDSTSYHLDYHYEWLMRAMTLVGHTPQGDPIFKTRLRINIEKVEAYFSTLVCSATDVWDEDLFAPCERCGSIERCEYMYQVNTGGEIQNWCPDCHGEHAFYCSECDQSYDVDCYDHTYAGGEIICQNCFEDNWTTCDECGEYIRIDDAYHCDNETLCEECYNEKTKVVREYHCNPELRFNRRQGEITDKFIGCEIETERGNYEERKNITLLRGDNESYIYQMHDGSLDDSGIECITQPMSKKFFDAFDFEGWMKELTDAGARSHYTNNCGLHIHLSKEWFGKNTDQQELTAGTVLAVMEVLKPQLQTAARRTDTHWCHYPDEPEFGRNKKAALESAKKQKFHTSYEKQMKKVGKCKENRYECLNLLNRNTYEFRIFRGTLNPKTFRASVALCIRLVEYAKYKNRNHSRGYSWEQFKAFKRMPKVLADYLTTRNL